MMDTKGSRVVRSAAYLATLLVCMAVTPAPARGQAAGEAEVREVVERLFDGMLQGDSALVRSTFHAQARLMTTSIREGEPRLQEGSVDEFVRAVGTPHEEAWDERIEDLEIRIDDPLATAWMDYRFYLGERLSHCGINAMQLVRGVEGWKILQVVDTRRTDCRG